MRFDSATFSLKRRLHFPSNSSGEGTKGVVMDKICGIHRSKYAYVRECSDECAIAERDLLKAEILELGEDRDRWKKLAGELAEAERCENCPDRGFTVREVGGCDPDGENDTRECVQEQCEFCYVNPKSRFNVRAAYDSVERGKQ